VITAHHRHAHGDDALTDFVGTRVIADNVSQVHPTVMRRGRGETRLQRFKIGVDIAEHQKTHVYRISAASTGQRAKCPGATSTNDGNACEQDGKRHSQRGSNAHPGGKAAMAGTVPSIVRSG
jgi:hypothetical protein